MTFEHLCPECIFCEKILIRTGSGVVRKWAQPVEFRKFKHRTPSWKNIESRAQQLGNFKLYRKIKDKCLFSVEAKYHPSCRNKFNTEYLNHVSHETKEKRGKSGQARISAAHNQAFTVVCSYIQKNIVDEQQVVPLSVLHDYYIEELRKHDVQHDYRRDQLRKRLKKDKVLQNAVDFAQVQLRGCVSFHLVYSKAVTVSDAIVAAYKLGTTDQIRDTAQTLHALIKKAFTESKEMPWPPTPDEVEEIKPSEQLPGELIRPLNVLLSGGN